MTEVREWDESCGKLHRFKCVKQKKKLLEPVYSVSCYISPLSSTIFPLSPISVPRLLFISPTLPLFFQCALRGKEAEEDRHETNPKQLQTKGWRKQVMEAWTRSTVGCTRVRKPHIVIALPRAAILVLLAGQNLPTRWRNPKARAGSLA